MGFFGNFFNKVGKGIGNIAKKVGKSIVNIAKKSGKFIFPLTAIAAAASLIPGLNIIAAPIAGILGAASAAIGGIQTTEILATSERKGGGFKAFEQN